MDGKYRAKILKMQALQQMALYNILILWKNGLVTPIIVGDICMFNHNLFCPNGINTINIVARPYRNGRTSHTCTIYVN